MSIEIIKEKTTLEALQKKVGGYIELVALGNGNQLIVDEDAKLKGKLPNKEASALAGVPIAGPAVIIESIDCLD